MSERVVVEVRGLETFGPHGVTEAEREAGCRIVLDIALTVDAGATATDEISETVDYSALTKLATSFVAERSFRTLERLSAELADEIEAAFDVAGLEHPRRQARAADERGAHRRRGDADARRVGSPGVVGYLGLGSNVGDRWAHLRAAVTALREHGVEVEAVSGAYETEPVGEILDQPDFLNAAVRIRTDLDPMELLDLCKEIEAESGRMFGGPRHGPRTLDVDLLLLGDVEMETDRLRLPHREVTGRRFVLVPLLELDPDLALPGGTRLRDALAALGDGERVQSRRAARGLRAVAG